MVPQLNLWLNRTGTCVGFSLLFGVIGCSNTSSYTRVPPPGTWGSASNSYYSLPGNSWTPAAPGAVGSGVSPAPPPTAGAQPTASNPTTNKTTQNSGANSDSAVQTASATSDSNPVRIAVFSDSDADDSQVVPAGSPPLSGTTTVPASQLPWRNP